MTRACLTLGALGALVAAMAAPTVAEAAKAYTDGRLQMFAGPGERYPDLVGVPHQSRVELIGCLPQGRWCDVQFGPYRGWVNGDALRVKSGGRYTSIYGAGFTSPVADFDFDAYWNVYYRDRPFYSERRRWRDLDRDGTENAYDRDVDGDGVANRSDIDPYNRRTN